MPLYTYRCQNKECNTRKEVIVKYDNRENEQTCDKCTNSMKFEPFTPGDGGSNLYFKGKFFANTGGY